jgi:hypothetical protein
MKFSNSNIDKNVLFDIVQKIGYFNFNKKNEYLNFKYIMIKISFFLYYFFIFVNFIKFNNYYCLLLKKHLHF